MASNKAVTCAELVLDVSPKTQRVILKKKVRVLGIWRLLVLGSSSASCPPAEEMETWAVPPARVGPRQRDRSSPCPSRCPGTAAPGFPSPSRLQGLFGELSS